MFHVEIVSTREIPNLIIRNESSGQIGYKVAGKTVNADGSVSTVVELSVGTAQTGRVFSVCNGDEVIGQFTIDIFHSNPSGLEILEINAPQSVVKNRIFRFTVVSSQKIPSLVIRNENGGKMGATIVNQTTNADGSVSTVMEMSVGTVQAGRVFKIYNGETLLGEFTIDITVAPPVEMAVISVNAPSSVLRNTSFNVSIVTTKQFAKLYIWNETGGKIGHTVLSKTLNADYSYTTVIQLCIGTAGYGRILSIYDAEANLRTFTINVM